MIKSTVIGRKNFLFSNTPRGAKASAVIYSIVETVEANGLKLQAYLQHLFEQLPQLADPTSRSLEQTCFLISIFATHLPFILEIT